MKKLIISIIFAFGFGIGLNAQSDSFFKYNNNESRTNTYEWGTMPLTPGSHGLNGNQSAAPLGNGLLILGGLAFLWLRSKDNK